MRPLLFTGILSLILSAGCAGSDVKENPGSDADFASSALKTAAEPIDSTPAQELFFILPSPVECLTVTVKADSAGETILKEPMPQKVCFSVEKPVRVSSSAAYYELGKNNTSDWELKDRIAICSEQNSPFQKLTPGIYRLRVTTFSKKGFTAHLSLSVPGIRFFRSYSEAEDYMRSLNEQRKKSE